MIFGDPSFIPKLLPRPGLLLYNFPQSALRPFIAVHGFLLELNERPYHFTHRWHSFKCLSGSASVYVLIMARHHLSLGIEMPRIDVGRDLPSLSSAYEYLLFPRGDVPCDWCFLGLHSFPLRWELSVGRLSNNVRMRSVLFPQHIDTSPLLLGLGQAVAVLDSELMRTFRDFLEFFRISDEAAQFRCAHDEYFRNVACVRIPMDAPLLVQNMCRVKTGLKLHRWAGIRMNLGIRSRLEQESCWRGSRVGQGFRVKPSVTDTKQESTEIEPQAEDIGPNFPRLT
ncbi:hypothetical protein Tco_0817842 [Tanacetum coccineum]